MESGIILSVTILAGAAGCTQTTNSVAPNKGKVPFLSEGWASSNYAATFEIHKTTMTLTDSSARPQHVPSR